MSWPGTGNGRHLRRRRIFWRALALLALTPPPQLARAEQEQETPNANGPPTSGPATTAPRPSHGGRSFDWFVVPLLAYNSDNGLGFGARAEIALKKDGYFPYRTAYMIQGYASLANYHNHLVRFDRVGMGRGKRFRLTINGAYRQWGRDEFWGLGNATTQAQALTGHFPANDPRRTYYFYRLIQPFVHVALRLDLTSRWRIFLSLDVKWSDITAPSGSLLATERPTGIEGGLNAVVASGVLYDSRDSEADPRQGIFGEASLFATIPNPWTAGDFFGAFLSLRGYVPLASWLTLAGRAMTELMVGRIPFFEMVHWHGFLPICGFGGLEVVRGVPHGRWLGPQRAVGSAELRFRLGGHTLFSRSVAWQLGLFGDGGMVWGGKPSPFQATHRRLPVHLAGGLGIRIVYSESFVGRVDCAVGEDLVRETSGESASALSYGVYLAFGHAF